MVTSMTDTAYLYQYFLENSNRKDTAQKDNTKENMKQSEKEDKRDGKPAKQRA